MPITPYAQIAAVIMSLVLLSTWNSKIVLQAQGSPPAAPPRRPQPIRIAASALKRSGPDTMPGSYQLHAALCSPVQCGICSDSNPCQIADVAGSMAHSTCLKPDFLGGSVDSSSLCGQGTAEPITHPSTGAVIATAMLFRNSSGFMHVTVSAECGWLLVPMDGMPSPVMLDGEVLYAAAGNSSAAGAAAPSSRGLLQSADGTGDSSSADSVSTEQSLEGTSGARGLAAGAFPFSAPFSVSAAAVVGGLVPAVQPRYACFSTSVQLAGLPSACAALDLSLQLRFAISAFSIVADGTCAAQQQAGDGNASVLEIDAMFGLSSNRAQPTPHPAHAPPAPSSSPNKQGVQQLGSLATISGGYKVLSTYTVTVNPVSDVGSTWLRDMSAQAPLVALSYQEHRVSFLVGAVATYGGGGVVDGLACSMTSMGLARTALGAWMYISDDSFRDITCLATPYNSVHAEQLPPCAEDAPVLFNVSLLLPGTTDIIAFYYDLQILQTESPSNCLSLPRQVNISSDIVVQLRAADGTGNGATGSLSTVPSPTSRTSSPPPVASPTLTAAQVPASSTATTAPVARSPSGNALVNNSSLLVGVCIAVTACVVLGAALFAYYARHRIRTAESTAKDVQSKAAASSVAQALTDNPPGGPGAGGAASASKVLLPAELVLQAATAAAAAAVFQAQFGHNAAGLRADGGPGGDGHMAQARSGAACSAGYLNGEMCYGNSSLVMSSSGGNCSSFEMHPVTGSLGQRSAIGSRSQHDMGQARPGVHPDLPLLALGGPLLSRSAHASPARLRPGAQGAHDGMSLDASVRRSQGMQSPDFQRRSTDDASDTAPATPAEAGPKVSMLLRGDRFTCMLSTVCNYGDAESVSQMVDDVPPEDQADAVRQGRLASAVVSGGGETLGLEPEQLVMPAASLVDDPAKSAWGACNNILYMLDGNQEASSSGWSHVGKNPGDRLQHAPASAPVQMDGAANAAASAIVEPAVLQTCISAEPALLSAPNKVLLMPGASHASVLQDYMHPGESSAVQVAGSVCAAMLKEASCVKRQDAGSVIVHAEEGPGPSPADRVMWQYNVIAFANDALHARGAMPGSGAAGGGSRALVVDHPGGTPPHTSAQQHALASSTIAAAHSSSTHCAAVEVASTASTSAPSTTPRQPGLTKPFSRLSMDSTLSQASVASDCSVTLRPPCHMNLPNEGASSPSPPAYLRDERAAYTLQRRPPAVSSCGSEAADKDISSRYACVPMVRKPHSAVGQQHTPWSSMLSSPSPSKRGQMRSVDIPERGGASSSTGGGGKTSTGNLQQQRLALSCMTHHSKTAFPATASAMSSMTSMFRALSKGRSLGSGPPLSDTPISARSRPSQPGATPNHAGARSQHRRGGASSGRTTADLAALASVGMRWSSSLRQSTVEVALLRVTGVTSETKARFKRRAPVNTGPLPEAPSQ